MSDKLRITLPRESITAIGALTCRAWNGDPSSIEAVKKLKQIEGIGLNLGAVEFKFGFDRMVLYDNAVKEILKIKPDAIIMQLGAGLCTRFERIDNGLVTWIDVDHPEIGFLRRQIFDTSSPRYHFIPFDLRNDMAVYNGEPRSLFDIDVDFIVAEAVLCYLQEKRAIEIVKKFKKPYAFDAIGPKRTVELGQEQYWQIDEKWTRWGFLNKRKVTEFDVDLEERQSLFIEGDP